MVLLHKNICQYIIHSLTSFPHRILYRMAIFLSCIILKSNSRTLEQELAHQTLCCLVSFYSQICSFKALSWSAFCHLGTTIQSRRWACYCSLWLIWNKLNFIGNVTGVDIFQMFLLNLVKDAFEYYMFNFAYYIIYQQNTNKVRLYHVIYIFIIIT